jgi:hypothetical protein
MTDINDPSRFGIQDGYRVREYPLSGGGPWITGYTHLCDACSHEHRHGQASRHNTAPGTQCASRQHESNVLLANSGAQEPTEYDQYRAHPDVIGWGKDDFSGRGKDVSLCSSCAEDRRSSGTNMTDYYALTKNKSLPEERCTDCGHDLHAGRKEASMSTQRIDPRDFEPVSASIRRTAAHYGEDGQYPTGGTIVRRGEGSSSWGGPNYEYHADGDPACEHSRFEEDAQCHGHYNPPHPLQKAIEKHQNYKGTRSHVPVMNNTWIHQDTEGAYHIRHHDTDILSVAPNGDTTINPGGYHTPSTMKRLHQFLPRNAATMKNPSKAQGAPDRVFAFNPNGGNVYGHGEHRARFGFHTDTQVHPYTDGFSFNAHTGEVLDHDAVRPGTMNRPPQARGTGNEPPRRSTPRRTHDDWYGGPMPSGRPGVSPVVEPYRSTPMHEQESTHEQIHRQLRNVDQRPATEMHDWDSASMQMSHHDLPAEGESFDQWMDRTTAPVRKACPTCKGKGDVRDPSPLPEGKSPWEHRKECTTCGGEGIVHAKTSRRFDRRALALRYQAGLRMLSYGETKAPEAVDTLRDDICPICGESDSYSGEECGNCGFIAPPSMFQDPDLDKAKQLDLRGDQQEAPGQFGVTDPDAFPELPPVDPEVVDQEGGVPTGEEEEQDPEAAEDAEEEDSARVEGEVRSLDDGDTGDEEEPTDPEEVDEDGNIGGPTDPEAADTHVNQGGEPFTPGPNAPTPEEPLEPGEDQAAEEEEQAAEEQGAEAQVGEGGPGYAGDEVPDLFCPACGFGADSAHPTTTPSDPTAPANAGDGAAEGDVCPNCQKATLMSGAAPATQGAV